MKRVSNVLISLFAFKNKNASVSFHMVNASTCRSNATHIAWRIPSASSHFREHLQEQASERRRIESSTGDNDEDEETWKPFYCSIQSRKDAEKTCMDFLRKNIMAFDEPYAETMGFPVDDSEVDTDGLGNGLVEPTISLALDAKVLYGWTDDLPIDIFLEYVLNYANLNEARTNWRPLMVDALQFNKSDFYQSSLKQIPGTNKQESSLNITSVTTWMNTHMWSLLARREDKPIYFKSSQTPLIFDPMSTISFGYASCTGTSILFCNALRAVGIPARVAGTPAWYGNRTQGNHNWVEVYVPGDDGGEWKFLEPSPALPNVDTLDSNPCHRWFCDPSRYPASKVYAARLSKDEPSNVHFPLAWEWNCRGVPSVDRTDYYTEVCDSCGGNEDQE